MQFDREKLKAVILYVCQKCDPSRLGAVKLHKVLYFSDMFRYAVAGAPITGATYRKRPFGPTCDQLLPILSTLSRENALEIQERDYFGYRKKEFISKEDPDLSKLKGDEISLLNEVISFVCENNSAKTISEFSHNKAWELAEFGDELPYYSSLHLFPTQVSLEAFEWAGSQVAEIEARAERQPLEIRSSRDLRSRILQARGS